MPDLAATPRNHPASARLALLLTGLALCTIGCTGPRSMLNSPEVTAKGHWRAGGNMDVNLPTQTADALEDGINHGINMLVGRLDGKDTASIAADSLNPLTRALVAYSLDPIGPQTGVFIRYGFLSRWDAGYRLAGAAHTFDVRYQFLGPVAAGPRDASANDSPSEWQGSAGIQYSQQSYDLPSVVGLDKLQELLQFEFKRKDIMVPVAFGKPWGKQGRYGGFGIGGMYNLSLISYGAGNKKLLERLPDGTTRAFKRVEGEKKISSYGGFANLRLGYKYVYLLGSANVYYQNYGKYELFGGQTTELKGWTFIPALGLEFRI